MINIGALAIGVIATGSLAGAVTLALRLLRQKTGRAPAAPPLLLLDPRLDVLPPAPPPGPAPPQPAPARLTASLIAVEAPTRLRFPLRITLGRILELNIPLRLDWSGDYPLKQVELRLLTPNELTYGPSLERLGANAAAVAPGVSARYASGKTHTLVTISAPETAPKTSLVFPVPISVKAGGAGEYPLQLSLSCPALGVKDRRYRLDLIEIGSGAEAAELALSVPDAWTCLPDEESRLSETDRPLDRILSTRFAIVEPPAL